MEIVGTCHSLDEEDTPYSKPMSSVLSFSDIGISFLQSVQSNCCYTLVPRTPCSTPAEIRPIFSKVGTEPMHDPYYSNPCMCLSNASYLSLSYYILCPN